MGIFLVIVVIVGSLCVLDIYSLLSSIIKKKFNREKLDVQITKP